MPPMVSVTLAAAMSTVATAEPAVVNTRKRPDDPSVGAPVKVILSGGSGQRFCPPGAGNSDVTPRRKVALPALSGGAARCRLRRQRRPRLARPTAARGPRSAGRSASSRDAAWLQRCPPRPSSRRAPRTGRPALARGAGRAAAAAAARRRPLAPPRARSCRRCRSFPPSPTCRRCRSSRRFRTCPRCRCPRRRFQQRRSAPGAAGRAARSVRRSAVASRRPCRRARRARRERQRGAESEAGSARASSSQCGPAPGHHRRLHARGGFDRVLVRRPEAVAGARRGAGRVGEEVAARRRVQDRRSGWSGRAPSRRCRRSPRRAAERPVPRCCSSCSRPP